MAHLYLEDGSFVGPGIHIAQKFQQRTKEVKFIEKRKTLQQNVFLVTKISEEIFFVTKNTALVTKFIFRH